VELLALLNNLTLPAPASDVALFLARLVMGITFLNYGWPKLRDLRQNARDFEEIHGLHPGWLWGTLIALLETFGSLGLIAGVFTPFLAASFAIHMLVGTIWKVTQTEKPFSDWSYDLLLLSGMLLLLVTGPGAFALRLF
jgi:uncharacterized membrane protein YphA (DoxX/SURF4 family)